MSSSLYLTGWKVLADYIALWREKRACGDLLILDPGTLRSFTSVAPELFQNSLNELIKGGVISYARELVKGDDEKLEIRFSFTVIEAIVERSFTFPEELQEVTAHAVLSATFQIPE